MSRSALVLVTLSTSFGMAAQSAADNVPLGIQRPVATASGSAADVAVGDIDRDGDIDVVACFAAENKVAWYENNGASPPTFTERVVSMTALDVRSVAVGDLDSDGWLDIAAASHGVAGGTIQLFLNDGTPVGSFGTTGSAGHAGVTDVAVGDYNCDGAPDIVAASTDNDTINLYLRSSPSPTYQTFVMDTTTDAPSSVVLTDLDADADVDVIVAGTAENAVVAISGPAGSFTRRVLAPLSGASSAAAGDCTGDGLADVVAAAAAQGTVTFLRALSTGSFVSASVATGVLSPDAVCLADLDADGDLDILFCSAGSGTLRMLDNQGGAVPAWVSRTLVASGLTSAAALIAPDVDTDGDMDPIIASAALSEVSLYPNQSNHRSALFDVSVSVRLMGDLGGVSSPKLCDVDGDGDLDMIAEDLDSSDIHWYENDGTPTGTNWPTRVVDSGNDPNRYVTAGDIDGDGDPDALVLRNNIFWIRNDGTPLDGGWTQHGVDSALLTVTFNTIHLADMDDDCDLDVLATTKALLPLENAGAFWYENDGSPASGNWNRRTILNLGFGSEEATSAAAADIDRDGDTDAVALLSLGTAGFSLQWFASDGASPPAFSQNTPIGVPLVVNADLDPVIVGDFNGDSRVDVAIGRSWFQNNLPTGWITRSIQAAARVAADFDLDGDLDIVGDGYLLRNSGANPPVWTAVHIDPMVTVNAFGIDAGDIDRDGDPDLCMCLQGTGTFNRVVWFPNRGGNFSLGTTTPFTAFANTIASASTTSILTIDPRNLGRSGDGDLAMRQLRVKWETNFGLPMTSAEFNAMIDRLRFYRDDGDGVFNPIIDSLLVDQTDVQLTNGVSVTNLPVTTSWVFTDTPRFFVAVTPEHNARSLPVNRMIVTHLTDDGADRSQPVSACRDVAVDMPQTIEPTPPSATGVITFACPADYNLSGSVSVQDIFDFMAGFFTSDPRADFGGSGAISVQDLFDFLAEFYIPCS